MSNFILKSIEIDNFRSIKHQVFEVKNGLFVIVGNNRDNPGNNNGAGKTSIISACIWALTGSSLNGEVLADEVINLKVGKDCKVKCTFDTDQGELVIIRTRKDSELNNSLSIILNDQDISCHKIADTQERINQIIKVPFELLKSTIIMTSDMKSRFSDLTTQGRINLLESIRDYSIWNKVREVSKTDINEIDSKIKTNNNTINEINGSVKTYDSLISSLKQEKNSLEEDYRNNDYNAIITQLKISIQDLEAKYNEIQIDETKLNEYTNQIQTYNTQKDTLFLNSQQESDKIHNQYVESNKELNEQVTNLKNQNNIYDSQIKNIEFDIRTLNQSLSIINQWFENDTCPTCNRKLERTEAEITNKTQEKDQINEKIQSKTAEITTLDVEIQKNKDLLTQIEQTLSESISSEQEAVQNAKNSLKNDIESITNLIKSVENDKTIEQNRLNQLKNDKLQIMNQINEYKLDVTKQESKLNAYNEKINSFDDKIIDYTKKIQELEDQKVQIEQTNKELDSQKELFNYYYQQLGPKGNLRPWLLAKDINYLNVCIKKYVHKFFEDTDVYLTKPTLEDNSINIIVDCGKGLIKPVSSLSGGERKRVDLCIQLALYDLVKSTSLFNINFVCFDEIESALDGAGIRSLIDIIDERKDIIPTILWISNRDEVIECIKDKITVTKQNGFSEIKYE